MYSWLDKNCWLKLFVSQGTILCPGSQELLVPPSKSQVNTAGTNIFYTCIHFSTSSTIFVMQLWASVPHSCSNVKHPGVSDCRNFWAVPLSPALSLTEVVEVLHQVRSPAESFQNAPIRLGPPPTVRLFLIFSLRLLILITSALKYFSKWMYWFDIKTFYLPNFGITFFHFHDWCWFQSLFLAR